MNERTYGEDVLFALLAHSWKRLGDRYERRDDGVWLRSIPDRDLELLSAAERAALLEHPTHQPLREPALPFPFSLRQLDDFIETSPPMPELLNWLPPISGVREDLRDDGDLSAEARQVGRITIEELHALSPHAGEVALYLSEGVMPRRQGPVLPPPGRILAQHVQEDAILAALRIKGHNPLCMPKAPRGNKPWPLREELRLQLKYSEAVMRKAWTRLRHDKRITEE